MTAEFAQKKFIQQHIASRNTLFSAQSSPVSNIPMLQRLIGNRAVQQLVRPSASPTIQRQLIEDGESVGDQIKIWIPNDGEVGGEIETVYLAKAYENGDEEVLYYTEPLPKTQSKKAMKGLGKPLKIKAAYAFSVGTKNSLIEKEVGQIEEASELDYIPDEVAKYVLGVVQTYQDSYEMDVVPTLSRIKLVLSGAETFKVYFEKDGDNEDVLSTIEELLEGDEGEWYRDQLMEELGTTGVYTESSGGSGGMGEGTSTAKKDWKTPKTTRLKGELLKQVGGMDGAEILEGDSTLHHKMSRNHLKKMVDLLDTTPSLQSGVSEMRKFIGEVQQITGKGDPKFALGNWTANIELGVLVDKRKEGDDPGKRFDGNFPSGIATPRTQELEYVDDKVDKASVGTELDWSELVRRLKIVQVEHNRMTKEQGRKSEHFTTPLFSQWKTGEDGFERDKKTT